MQNGPKVFLFDRFRSYFVRGLQIQIFGVRYMTWFQNFRSNNFIRRVGRDLKVIFQIFELIERFFSFTIETLRPLMSNNNEINKTKANSCTVCASMKICGCRLFYTNRDRFGVFPFNMPTMRNVETFGGNVAINTFCLSLFAPLVSRSEFIMTISDNTFRSVGRSLRKVILNGKL